MSEQRNERHVARKSMQISLSTGCLYCYPLKSAFSMARATGFDGVELVVSPEIILRGSGYVRALAERYSLPIYSVHPPMFPFAGWADLANSIRKAALLAGEVGSPVLVVHPPRTASLNDEEGERYVGTVLETARTLEGTGTRLAIENPGIFWQEDRNFPLHDPVRLRDFVDCHDLPMTLDTSHVASFGGSLDEALALMDGRIVNVHISDARRPPRVLDRPLLDTYFKHHQFPGEGWLPLKQFVADLADRGYDGPLTLELSPFTLRLWWPPATRRRLIQSVARIRDYLGQATS